MAKTETINDEYADLRTLRVDQVLGIIPLSKASLYRYVSDGTFPAPIKLNGVSLWPASEIAEWLECLKSARPKTRSNEDII